MMKPVDMRDTRGCPICGKPVVARFRPFCSGRCADVDLNRWLSGTYAVPAVESEDDTEAPPQERGQDGNAD
jgi:endogenous inhibitor of DNA gyrase (YacG/DUF329 family)